MSQIGKESKSYRKVDLENQRVPSNTNKKIVFAHQSPGSETVVNLGSLTLPPSMSANGFANPDSATILQAHLLLYRKNLTLYSSLRGQLFDYLTYTITGPQTINLIGLTRTDGTAGTETNEIIYGVLDLVPQSPNLFVDATPITVTGTLTAGSTDIVVGTGFTVNAYSPAQIGQVMLFIDGKVQFRNALNVTASSTADGNYQEVGASGSTSNLLRMNQTSSVDRAYIVISTQGFVERPDGSMQGQIESMAGAVNAMKSTVAALAGVDPSTFGITPSTIDLTAFGNTVFQLQQNVVKDFVIGTPLLSSVSNTSASYAPFSPSTPILTFTPKATGKYRVKLTGSAYLSGTSNVSSVRINNTVGSATLLFSQQITISGTQSSPFETYAIYSLTKGTTYTFQLEARAGSGLTLTLYGTTVDYGHAIIAEQVD